MAAKDISTLQVKVTSDGIKDTTKQLNDLSSSAGKAEKAVKTLATAIITSNSGLANATGASTALVAAIQRLNGVIATQTQTVNNNTSTVNNNTTVINNNTTATNNNTASVTRNAAAFRDAHDAARGLAGSLGALWVTYGNMIPLAAGLGLGTAIKGVISSGSQVEHAIETMRVKGGETVAVANQLRDAIYSVGQGVYGPNEVAKALDALVMAGLSGKDAIDALHASLNLATAGGGSVEKAAESLVTIGTAVGASAKDYDYLADGISKAANVSLSSVDSIAEAMKRGSVVNKLYGASFEDILVQTAALSNLGIKNSAAGTAVTNFYGDLTGKTQKSKDAIKELGMSFFDADGKAKPLVATVEEFQQKLNKFNQGKQDQLIMNIFGERGQRTAVALLALVNQAADDSDKYKNKLEELQAQIEDMAGTSALAAAQLAMTTENQFKSMGNSLQVTFAKVFKDLEPTINVVSAALKRAFASPEFQTGLTNMISGVVGLVRAMVENKDTILLAVDALVLWKAATLGGQLFTTVAIAVQGAAKAFGLMAVGMDAAAIAATGLTRALSVIGSIVAVLSAGWALYSMFTHKSTDDAKEKADAYNSNYLEALRSEADRLDAVNNEIARGTDLRDAEAKATRTLALEKAKLNAQSSIETAQSKLDDLVAGRKKAPWDAKGTYDKEIKEATAELAKVKREQRDMIDDIVLEISRIEVAGQTQRHNYLKRQEEDQERLKAAAGTSSGIQPIDKELQKRINFYEGERLELERLIATYKARTAAVLEGAEAERRVKATVEVDRVKANGPAKYPSMKAYNDELALADKADEAKFAQQKANAITEQENKITEVLQREAAYKKTLNDADYERMGMLEKQTVAILKFNGATEETIAKERERAKAADEVLRVEDARKKLDTATGSANQRAQTLIAEADAMGVYGKTAKATAVQVAELEIAKLRLNGTDSDKQIAARKEAAAMEDLARSYNELTKQAEQLQKREDINSAIGVAGVIGAESAKVEAIRQTTEKALAYDMQRAESALEVARASGNPEMLKSAQAVYDKMAAKAKTVGALIKKQFTIDFKVAGLKDIGDTFSRMAHDANAMGESFAHVGTALDGVGASFNKLAEIQAAVGISEEERQKRQIGAYGDMAQASASFFQENSKGYKIMMGISKVFHAIEMAQSLARIGVLAVEAVLNQAKGDPYTAFARMAAMAAVVAGLGYAVSGGFSSNNGGKSAADVQKTQGAGGVFGDADKKSESILKSIENMKDVANSTLPLTQQMAHSLSNIESAMVGVTNLVLRTSGVTDGSNMGIQTGTLSRYGDDWHKTLMGTNRLGGAAGGATLGFLLGGPIGAAAGSIVGGIAGPLLGKLVSLWGKTTQEIKDSGIAFKGTVSELQGGAGYSQYASVDTTKSSWFGLKKNTSNQVVSQGLSSELSQQFGLIFTSLEDALKSASTALGKDANSVAKAIDNLVIDTSVSLKDLKGADLQAALNGVISKTMDDIAQAAFPQMDAFRQVGEGYAQTVIRVATSVEQASVALKALGITAIDYNSMTNKTGDVAFELVKQSIALKEAGTGVGQIVEYINGTMTDLTKAYTALVGIRSHMDRMGLGTGLNVDTVNGAGGADKLSSALDTFQSKYFSATEQVAMETAKVGDQFKAIGSELPDSRETLRSWIEAAAKAGDQLKVGQLLSLADNFDTLQTAMENLNKTTEEATKNTIELAQKAYDDAVNAAENAYSRLEKSISAQKDKVQKAKDATQATIDGINSIISTIGDALKATAPMASKAGAFADALDAISQAASMIRGGADINSFKGLNDFIKTASSNTDTNYSTLLDFQRDQARANAALTELNDAGKGQLSAAEQQLDAEQKQLDALDAQLAVAQQQLDTLKGIDNTLLSVEEAFANFKSAIDKGSVAKATLDATKVGTGVSDQIESLYKSILGRASDEAGKSFWVDAVTKQGASLGYIADQFYNSNEYKANHPSFDVGTNYVPNDMVANIHKGERIIPAADNAELMRRLDNESSNAGNAAIAVKLDELIEAIQVGDVANVQKTNELYKLVRDRIVPNIDGTVTQ